MIIAEIRKIVRNWRERAESSRRGEPGVHFASPEAAIERCALEIDALLAQRRYVREFPELAFKVTSAGAHYDVEVRGGPVPGQRARLGSLRMNPVEIDTFVSGLVRVGAEVELPPEVPIVYVGQEWTTLFLERVEVVTLPDEEGVFEIVHVENRTRTERVNRRELVERGYWHLEIPF